MEKHNIMITGVGGGGVGEQTLKALRLSKTPYYIVGGDMLKTSKGLKQVDVPYILPPARDAGYLPAVIEICKKHDIHIVFYGSEPELKVFNENREMLESEGIFVPLNPRQVIDICMDKSRTMRWFEEQQIPCPRSIEVRSIEDIHRIDYLPVVLKPSVGGGGSVNTFIAQSRDELEMFTAYLLKMYDVFIAQEYIGRYDQEYTVGVMCDYITGEYVNSIAVKKSIMSGLSNKMKIVNRGDTGKYGDYLVISNGISQGAIGRFPEVTEQCREIAMKLGARGPINIQCRFVDGKVYVFEINPRISGTTSLRAMVGYNEPEMLIRSILDHEKIETDFPYEEGYIVRGLEETYISEEFMDNLVDYSVIETER